MSVARHVLLHARKVGGGGAAPLLPLNSIAMWSGTLVSIPAGWSLCDGTGGTPNLVARFLRGAPAATNPGTTGGADTHTHDTMTSDGAHTHTVDAQTHNHTVGSAGGHAHAATSAGGEGGGGATPPMGVATTIGAHTHTTNSDAGHTHTNDSQGAHTHSISTDDGRPPYYEVAFIQAGAAATVAANLIIIWTGTIVDIPAGWALCNGAASPDLRAKFIRGVNTSGTNPGTTGGATTHNHTEGNDGSHTHTFDGGGSHTHTFNAYTWTHSHALGTSDENRITASKNQTGAGGDHTHAVSNDPGNDHTHNAIGADGTHAHTADVTSSLPAYYDVAYIINNDGATTIPASGVLIWSGTLASIPTGYSLCDGTGVTPELRSKFLCGASAGVDPGGTGGSDTHTHTEVVNGAHNSHTLTSAGAHTHSATDSIGTHTHATQAINYTPDNPNTTFLSTLATGGAHSHAYASENNHTHTIQNSVTHDHQPWSTDDAKPAYYEVAFIMKD